MLFTSSDMTIHSPSYAAYLCDLMGMSMYVVPVLSFTELRISTLDICSCCSLATEL